MRPHRIHERPVHARGEGAVRQRLRAAGEGPPEVRAREEARVVLDGEVEGAVPRVEEERLREAGERAGGELR